MIAQLLATEGRNDEAFTELKEIRPAFVEMYGPTSVHLRNLDRQISRLQSL